MSSKVPLVAKQFICRGDEDFTGIGAYTWYITCIRRTADKISVLLAFAKLQSKVTLSLAQRLPGPRRQKMKDIETSTYICHNKHSWKPSLETVCPFACFIFFHLGYFSNTSRQQHFTEVNNQTRGAVYISVFTL